jgi:hypothetical protein
MVLETAAFGEDGTEDTADTGGVERAGVALEDGVEDGGLTGFVGDREAILALEASNFSNGLGATVDELEEFEIELVDGGALLVKGRAHDASLLDGTCRKNTKAAIGDRGRRRKCVRSLES